MYPPSRPSTFQSCTSPTGNKVCCHERFCTMRSWCNTQLGQELRHDKSQEHIRRVMKSMDSSIIKANRKNPLEMLARLFPKHPIQALKRVLESCQGDPVFAIERILDQCPTEMDTEDVLSAPLLNEKQGRRPFSLEEDMRTGERRLNGVSDDHLSKLAMAYDIPLSLGKSHREEFKVSDSKMEQKGTHPQATEINENCERSEY